MMKKPLLSILALLVVVAAWGKPVERSQAADIALKFAAAHGFADGLIAEKIIEERLSGGELAYYVVSFSPSGWVMISADDVLKPVIGYSPDSPWQPREVWPENKRDWMKGYEKEISRVLPLASEMSENGEWKRISDGSSLKNTMAQVDPIIKVKWNQGSGWNRFCPEDEKGPGGYVYVGCVAVAMAQAMSVYQYPDKGVGTASYIHSVYGSQTVNFDREEPYQWSEMSLTASDDYNARLLYHCAVTVDMDFGWDGSGAQTSKCAASLKTYYNYAETARSIGRYDNEEEWIALLTDELLAGRPIIYSGHPEDGSAGHAFNIDGVGGGYFHLNWGWSGSYNDWYTINNLAPGTYEFNSGQAAVIGIRPPTAGPYDILLSNSVIDEGLAPGSFVGEIVIKDEFEGNLYEVVCKGPFNLFIGEEGDYGPSEFYVENDSIKVGEVLEYDDGSTRFLRIEVTDTAGHFYVEEFDIILNEVVQQGVTSFPETETDAVKIYPNPASASLRVEAEDSGTVLDLRIYSLTGQLLRQGAYYSGEVVDISDLPSGSYVLSVDMGIKHYYRNIIIAR